MEELNKIKINYGISNTFMIFGMLLLGAFFLLLLITVDALYSIGFVDKLSLLSNKLAVNTKSLTIMIPIIVLMLTSIGFTLYLASFIFLSAPSWRIMKLFYGKNLFSENIANKIFETNNVLETFSTGNILFKRGFLYFLLRNQNDSISSDIKFTFTQLMYGRAILFTIVIAVISIFGLLGDIVNLCIFGFLAYMISIVIYAQGLRLFDDILSMGYLAKNMQWLNSNRLPKETVRD